MIRSGPRGLRKPLGGEFGPRPARPGPPEANARTRAFARVIGLFLVAAPTLVAALGSDMDAFAAAFLQNAALVWTTGGLLIFSGAVIIAYHQYWSSPSAVFISLFGWILAIRGVVLLALPRLIVSDSAGAMIAFPAMRLGFGLLFLAGVWLTFVSWAAEPGAPFVPKR